MIAAEKEEEERGTRDARVGMGKRGRCVSSVRYTEEPSSDPQHVMNLFQKQQQQEQEQTKKIPFVYIERSLFISCAELDVHTNLLYALNKNSIWNSGSCATDEKFDANDQLFLFTGTIAKISCKHSFLRCLDRHNGRDFGKLYGVGILRQHRADSKECDGSCRDE
ncbi:uncharacterized protein MONOS_15503 [Monocercomonoides exilis]|uniref:uncharacterized protein n=1 Tax=Monocercomonoides exilis TaxID=2049356 RepID=UPI00355A641F|nr:hypothetical protein MONOS_15503 [Monocercomonoides exilis]|eukprot:MONOS_15503.1-p1 / transcript=MONOS_15503.1 / gene=MONOS_15503 / organism=Monocercomonoides_exilis_PA203 / gene_product=unspecified product / transcript_product=unspecified product / location=Mono_scaffold01253:6251-6869(-) / protein_length=165 / sequence_SO=supercontig / SO=protein_coding / is_pseudo=false